MEGAHLASLHRLRGLEVAVVLGNHPKQTDILLKRDSMTEGHNPFVDPTEWERFLAKTEEKYMEMVRNDPIRKNITGGMRYAYRYRWTPP